MVGIHSGSWSKTVPRGISWLWTTWSWVEWFQEVSVGLQTGEVLKKWSNNCENGNVTPWQRSSRGQKQNSCGRRTGTTVLATDMTSRITSTDMLLILVNRTNIIKGNDIVYTCVTVELCCMTPMDNQRKDTRSNNEMIQWTIAGIQFILLNNHFLMSVIKSARWGKDSGFLWGRIVSWEMIG